MERIGTISLFRFNLRYPNESAFLIALSATKKHLIAKKPPKL